MQVTIKQLKWKALYERSCNSSAKTDSFQKIIFFKMAHGIK